MKKRLVSFFTSLLMIFSLMVVMPVDIEVSAATFDDINANNVFLKQEGSTTCTLCSATMLLRRTAIMRGDSDWNNITESTVKSTAWINGQGLRNSFSYKNINIKYADISGSESSKKSQLISLLNEHPEGIVLYYGPGNKQHAVLLTDYTNGEFYCADPYGGKPSGRIKLSQCLYVTVANCKHYWYVSSPDVNLSDPLPNKTTVGVSAGTFGTPTSIWWDKVSNATSYSVRIFKDNTDFKSLWNQTGTSCSVDLPAGTYEVYVDSVNANGFNKSNNTVKFTVKDGNPVNLGNSFSTRIQSVDTGKLVTAAISQNGNVVMQSHSNNKLGNQIWNFKRNSDGSYTIANAIDNRVIDLYGSNDSDNANIAVCKNANKTNQKWFIYKYSDGSYFFKPVCSKTRVLSANGSAENANVMLSTYSGSKSQRFWIINDLPGVANLGDDFKTLILTKNNNKPIGVESNGNVSEMTEKRENYDRTLWHFMRDKYTGAYTIWSYYNGQTLYVDGSKNADSANVKCGDAPSADSKFWYIMKRPDGTYYLKSACSSRSLDLKGTNIQMSSPASTTNSMTFWFYPMDSTRDKLNYTISAAKTTAELNTKVNVTVAGATPYVYNYKFHIFDPNGKETTVDNKCNPVYSFSGSKVGKYIIWAEIKNPVVDNPQIGSKTNKCVTINVTCSHKYGSWTTTKAATCTTAGSKTRTCSVCGNKETAAIVSAGHTYGSWTTVKKATCTEDGSKTRKCSVCGNTETETISKTGHTAVTDPAVAATCVTAGKTEGSHCSKCNTVIKAQTTIASTGHSYNSWTTTKSATCTEDGTQTRKCTVCGNTETKAISKTGHSYTTIWVEPTLNTPGYTVYKCDNCGFESKEELQTVSVSGSVKTFGSDESTPTSIVLTASGSSEILYETTVVGTGTTAYSIPNVVTGDYTLTISKKNHTARTYDITIGSESITQDAEIHLFGDVNGDGRITVSDVAKVNSHIKGKSTLTDYDFAVADVNGDGKLTVSDTAKINAHMRGKSSLWK